MDAMEILKNAARDGDRLVYTPEGADKPKTLWGGLGNRAGLHSFASDVLSTKWKKSGATLCKKLDKLPAGTVVTIMQYRSTTRDRGTWKKVQNVTVGGEP